MNIDIKLTSLRVSAQTVEDCALILSKACQEVEKKLRCQEDVMWEIQSGFRKANWS